MKQKYECLYIIASNVAEEKRSSLIAKFTKMAGADTTVEKWGIKKFATPIDYRKDGFYVLMNFESEPDVPGKMGKLMNITDGIVRYMFVCKDQRNQKQKPKAQKKKAVSQ